MSILMRWAEAFALLALKAAVQSGGASRYSIGLRGTPRRARNAGPKYYVGRPPTIRCALRRMKHGASG